MSRESLSILHRYTERPSRLRTLPLSTKVVLTSFLLAVGIGFIIALIYLFLIDVEPHQKMGMDVLQGTIHKYYGRRGDTRLEAVLKGSMGEYISSSEKREILQWLEQGAREESFPGVKPIFEKNCVECHSHDSGMGIVPLATFEEVKEVTNVDLGESIKALARVSHVHLFGISIVFIITGFIFSLTSMNECLKIILIVTPFAAIVLDIGSWWFTKYQPLFALTVIIGGTVMGIAFGVQIIFSLYEIWVKRK